MNKGQKNAASRGAELPSLERPSAPQVPLTQDEQTRTHDRIVRLMAELVGLGPLDTNDKRLAAMWLHTDLARLWANTNNLQAADEELALAERLKAETLATRED